LFYGDALFEIINIGINPNRSWNRSWKNGEFGGTAISS